ncbi:MAG TPA: ester cyclase [Ktedonobacterales bacterium]
MPAEQNKALARRVIEEIWNKGEYTVLNQLLSPNFVFHDPSSPRVKTRQDYEMFATAYRRAFPDLRLVIEDQIAERELVMTWWGARGTNTGPLMGYAPTDRTVSITGISLDLIHNGQIVEERVNWDALGLFQQLGMVPMLNTMLPMGMGMYQQGAQPEARVP